MSDKPNNHSEVCHDCPAMAAIVSHIIAHATEQELHSNKNYVALKKDLQRQAILTAEYRCISTSIVSIFPFK